MKKINKLAHKAHSKAKSWLIHFSPYDLKSLSIQVLTKAQEWFLPRYCELCRAPSKETLCVACKDELPWMTCHCIYCALPLLSQADQDSICPDCLISPCAIDKTVCGFIYNFPLDKLIHQFKQHNQTLLGQYLTRLSYGKIMNQYSPSELPEILIPVPMHWKSQLKRGFNQAEVISEILSKATGVPTKRIIRKMRPTKQQHQLNKKQRNKNLERSFSITQKNEKYLENIRHVAIIDDVITTGATTNMLAKLLKKSGINKVDVWAIARTPKRY